ncbi:MAG: FecR domain-containing protein [Chitinophagaceae bacterium]|nr:FecR domain-containing protein [Chitinophagaceae bacterium]
MENEAHFLDLAVKSVSGNITGEEQQELHEMMQGNVLLKAEYEQIRHSWHYVMGLGDDFKPDAKSAWQQVKNRLNIRPSAGQAVISRLPLYRYMKYAAVIIAIVSSAIVAYYIYSNQAVKVTTARGERRQVTLPDKSTIWLNEESRLEYARHMNDKEQRRILLEGEAYFEVTKNQNRPFIVEAGSSITRVLGTSFNLRAVEGERIEVGLMEGKVSFADVRSKWSLLLQPGEMAYMERDGGHGKTSYRDTNFLFWKNRMLRFSSQPLEQVLSILGKAYNVEFKLQDSVLAKRTITASLQGDTIQNAIDVLQVMLNVNIVKKGTTYLVRSHHSVNENAEQ